MEDSKKIPFSIGYSNMNYDVHNTDINSNCSNNSTRLQDTVETINEIVDYDNEVFMQSHEPKIHNKTPTSNNSRSSGVNLTSQLHGCSSDSSIDVEHKSKVIKKDRSPSNFDFIQNKEIIELSSIDLGKKKSYAEIPTEGKSTILNNLIKKETHFSQKRTIHRFPDLLRCFILLLIGLPVLEGNHSLLNFNNPEYQQELRKKNFLMRLLNKKPIIAVILYIITLSTGILYIISTFWYVIENEIDPKIQNNLLKDCLLSIISIMWVSLGTFSISVLYNIFCSSDMKDAIKNETKSYFKIPAWFILLILVCCFIYCACDNISLEDCKNKDKEDILVDYVCTLNYFSSITFLIIGSFWNYLVAVIIMMISKTHTKLIRMLLTNIELDNINIVRVSDTIFEKSNQDMFNEQDSPSSLFANDNVCFTPELIEEFDNEASIVNKANIIRSRFDTHKSFPHKKTKLENSLLDLSTQSGIGSKYIEEHLKMNRIKLEECMNSSPENCPACLYRFRSQSSVRNCARVICVHIMSPNEILQYFSKILYVLRLTSSLTQRWTVAYVVCSLLWCTNCLISWIDDKRPSFTNLFQFILPLIILAVVCGIFAETNAEGSKLKRSISPLDERINMIQYIQLNPLEMTLYGFVLDYSVEVKFIGAFAIGFLSQIILHEIF